MAQATAPRRATKREYVNITQGWLGATRINRKGDDEGISVAAGERIFLTPEEVELTAQAHARAEDSPFVKRKLYYYEKGTQEPLGEILAAPLCPATEFERIKATIPVAT